jgi:O-acetylhomoserine/O-acetylserine sulfhydrylase-like pyridoxal-dependent enzyme
MLARYGVEVTYFDPLIGAAIESLFKPNTLRLHIGLENVDDLKADLDRGFTALTAV